ncbi:2OG-Fe(II) oxygenase [Sneathiella chinensis]|uniref:Prolyl 4-hydroxylase alpha subunit Fe(2+) 2OG dioxygenase domain-containing protein n=1 Tax=Sneathiella chinensis TaxID=349750 RepID=A0ABQ5U3C5_9PROT|nr:2OG-Fe(II) oxygenase [Sneathiella chinensis]GLQ05784.1 hypothetical protein GCM10007924_10050 [Sneathiella chinensis]
MNMMPLLPLRNTNVSMNTHWPLLSPQECAQIVARANPKRWEKKLPIGPGNVPIFPDAKMDKAVERQPLPLGQNAFPLDQVMFGLGQTNADNWRFELTGVPADDMPWLVRQSKGGSDEEHWQVDLAESFTSSRKLGFIIQLSDPKSYEGGDVVFHNIPADRDLMRAQGTVIVFPAFWLHRVTSVTKGVRHSIVGWIHGHNFR